ncbi:hypothetical protein [Chryseobacterium taichungense]|uniref:hypothetical protein n=1 Tax=Chryseobacterium taichungense TaxID=295069 RepID=UPI000B238137|nr:hypothetical protein [Chryseobacterium taichungense]
MKKFVLLFFGILLFDIVYIFVYDQLLISIQPEFLQYPFVFIKYFVSAPAIFYNRLLPFYAPIPMYLSLLIFTGNVLLQTLLIYTIFFRRKRKD